MQGRELIFGGLEAFHEGLEAVVGPPNPDLNAAMKSEHTSLEDAKHFFRTSNYGVQTKPCYEWWFVVDADKGREVLAKGPAPYADPDWRGEYPKEEARLAPSAPLPRPRPLLRRPAPRRPTRLETLSPARLGRATSSRSASTATPSPSTASRRRSPASTLRSAARASTRCAARSSSAAACTRGPCSSSTTW